MPLRWRAVTLLPRTVARRTDITRWHVVPPAVARDKPPAVARGTPAVARDKPPAVARGTPAVARDNPPAVARGTPRGFGAYKPTTFTNELIVLSAG